MACSDCHRPHGDDSLTDPFNAAAESCYGCHAEKRGPFLWEHAPATEDCTACHDPHGSNNPGMVSLRAPFLCQGCHTESGHPSIASTVDGLASGSAPSRFLLDRNCMNCHSQVHGTNHPSGSALMR